MAEWLLVVAVMLIVSFVPALAHAQDRLPSGTSWTSSGAGVYSVTDATYGVTLTYDINNSSVWNGQSWDFGTTAADAADISYSWTYSGLHAWFHASANLKSYVEHNGVRTTTTLYNQSVSGFFNGSGVSSFHVVAGDKYGFTISGENYDYNSILRGTVGISTAPVIESAMTGTTGGDGWYTSNVGLSWTLSDPASGTITSTGCDPVSLATDTSVSGVTYACTASSAGGSSTKSVTIKRDTTAPVTTDNAPSGTALSNVQVDLSASDAASGVAATYYRIDGGAQQTGTTATLTTNGVHTLAYWSVDTAGNVETSHTVTVTISKPLLADVTFVADKETPTNQPVVVTAQFPAEAVVSQFSYDAALWSSYTAPLTIADNRTVYAKYQDAYGNWSDVAHYTVANIDKEAPELPVVTLSTTAPAQEVTVTITYSADTVIRRYQLWGDYDVPYTGPFVLTSNRTLSAYATDAAGNMSTTTIGITNLDIVPPTVALTIDNHATTAHKQDVTLTLDDQGTGAAYMQFSDDNAQWSEWEAYNTTKLYSLSAGEGQKHVYARLRDVAGNISQSAEATIMLDLPPVISLEVYDGSTRTNQPITVRATVNQGVLNATEHTFTENGSFEFIATDEGGNVAALTVTITNIDKAAPVTTLGQSTDSLTKHVTLDLSAVDSEAGVAATYYTVDGVSYTGSHLVLTRHGKHQITYWSADTTGNVEAPHSLEVEVNLLPFDDNGQLNLQAIIRQIDTGTLEQIDLNGDEVFDRHDIQMMLDAITPMFIPLAG
uniref:Ig-like domain-containing protein n=2 Tax=Paenibacillus athensensis TaxID=1967502 RepID=A0A4Y8PSN3_9BACL